MPPHCRNQRLPTIGETPAIAAASSLECPCAIAFQNGDRFAHCSTGGLPGGRCLGRGDRSDFNPFCFINIAGQAVSQQRVEFTRYRSVDFGKRCKEMGVRPSMDSVGDAYIDAAGTASPRRVTQRLMRIWGQAASGGLTRACQLVHRQARWITLRLSTPLVQPTHPTCRTRSPVVSVESG